MYELLGLGAHGAEYQDPTSEFESTQNVTSSMPREWVSRWLQWPRILCAVLVTVALIAVVIALAVISQHQNGIGSVDIHLETPLVRVGDLDLSIALLWTTLPVLIFSIYGLVISVIVSQAAARQPYIELREYSDEHWGAAAEKSIMLDYASYWSVVAPWKAIRNRHWVIAYSLSLTLVVNILLSALSAHIFNATTILFAQSVNIERAYEIDDTGLDGAASLVPTIDIVSSTSIYGGQTIPWTNQNISVLPFVIPQSLQGKPKWNLKLSATALTAKMSCKELSDSEFELLKSDNDQWYFSLRDRGCFVKPFLFVVDLKGFYTDLVQTYWFDCDLEAYYGRIVLVAAQKSETDSNNPTLTNKIGVSCIPSYYHVTGNLNITSDASSAAGFSIGSFVPTDPVLIDPYPVYGLEFARRIHLSTLADPTARLYANTFGSLLYYAAKEHSSLGAFSGATFLDLTSSLYKSAFAVMVQRFLVKESSQSSQSSVTTGTAFTEEYRVVVVPAIAYTVVGILVALLGMLGWIYWYTKNHVSILYEEPVALTGAAANLRRSELMRRIESIGADDWDGRVRLGFEYEIQNLDPKQGWRVDQWERPSYMKIVATDRARI